MLKIYGDVRLTKDVTVKTVAGDKLVANTSIANNRGTGDNKQTDFIDLVGWDNVASAMENLKKGQMVNIIGSFQMRSWTDKEGKTRSNPEIVLDAITLANVRKKDDADGAPAPASTPTKKTAPSKKAAPVQPAPEDEDFAELEEDGELPF